MTIGNKLLPENWNYLRNYEWTLKNLYSIDMIKMESYSFMVEFSNQQRKKRALGILHKLLRFIKI